MVLLHWETLYCLHQHGQGDGQPCKTGRVVQHGRSHGEPQAYGKRWGCREALSYGTAYDGLDADRAIFESAVRTWQKEIRSVSQRGSCRWTNTPRWVSLASAPLVLPHQRGHEPLPTPKPTRDTDSLRTWRPVTPAMAVGIADHVWATSAWLSSRVSTACLDQWRAIEYLSLHWDKFHHGS
jgi:hypothetical protein